MTHAVSGGRRKSFLVLFPSRAASLASRSDRIFDLFPADIGGIRCSDFHLTIHYFTADPSTCARLAESIPDALPLVRSIEMVLDRAVLHFSQKFETGWVSLLPAKEEALLVIRRNTAPLLEKLDIMPEPEDSWTPHITLLGNVPGRPDFKAREERLLHPPFRIGFDQLRLTRWLGGTEFETVGAWRLDG